MENINVYQMVTDRVVKALETEKTLVWRKPWRTTSDGSSLPRNLATKKPYNGINILLLAMSGFQSPWWLSFKQVKTLGGTVRAGEKGTPIVFWSFVEKENSETKKIEKFCFAKYYTVFNSEQCEGIEVPAVEKKTVSEVEKLENCEKIVAGFKDCPKIQEKEQQAYYNPISDIINMPKRNSFEGSEEYYSVLYHEMIHSCGHSSRLNRKGVAERNFFASEEYSKEELIAELGSTFLATMSGIELETKDNSVAYIQGWIKALKGNSRLIIDAAAAAQKSVDYVLGLKGTKESN